MNQQNVFIDRIRQIVRDEFTKIMQEELEGVTSASLMPTAGAKRRRSRGKSASSTAATGTGKGRVVSPDDKRLKANREA